MEYGQGTELIIDTEVLKEKNYADVAWSDQYDVEILTRKSQLQWEKISQKKNEQRTELSLQLFLESKEQELTVKALIENRMADIPVFTSKADYYSLDIEEKPKEPSPGVWLFFFVILGICGYLLARYSINRRKGRENHVYNGNIAV